MSVMFTIVCGVIHVRLGPACCFSDQVEVPAKEEGMSFEGNFVAQRGHVPGEAFLHLASVSGHGAVRTCSA